MRTQPVVGEDGVADLSPDELQIRFHDVECATYDERFGIAFDGRGARSAARETERLLGVARLGRVLDVGCGTGYLGLGLLASGRAAELHAVDISAGMLDRARRNADGLGVRARFVRASATELPFPAAEFDAVVTRGVLHHLHDPLAALREWRRVVRPGGPVLVLSEPSPQADRFGGAVARATLAALRGARQVAGAFGGSLSAHDSAAEEAHRFWDLVAMAANLHTFTTGGLRSLAEEAGFDAVDVRGAGAASIAWAAAYYVLVGELPGLASSEVAKRRASLVWELLRRLDAAVVERLVPGRALLTVQAVFR